MAHTNSVTDVAAGALLRQGAGEVAAMIRARALSPAAAVDAYIQRIREMNPGLNAVVGERFQEAREEARAAATGLAGGDPVGPLHGVPFTVKEMINVAGLPNTFGNLNRRGRTADEDATVVARLRRAGAIPLGVTNIPELGLWYETANLVYGRTVNPYDPRRTPGGSSGGEAATVAVGGVPFGLGSDLGGSIRIPAAFCGVFGHKPTHGLLPLTGHYPVYASGPDADRNRFNPYVTLGPLTRTARDLMPLLRIMAGPDDIDPNAEDLPLGDPAAVDWTGRKVLLLEDPRIHLTARAAPKIRSAVGVAARRLQERGACLDSLPPDFFRRAVDLWFAALQSLEGTPITELLGCGQRIHPLREILRWALRRPRHTLPALLFVVGEGLFQKSEPRMRRLLGVGRRLGEELAGLLGEDGVFIMPAHPRTAPRHHRALLHPFDFGYTAILNVLRIPVTTAPVTLDEDGLPVAVQIGATRGNDHLTIGAARIIEDMLWSVHRDRSDH